MSDFEKTCQILSQIAASYPHDSVEGKAMYEAGRALHFAYLYKGGGEFSKLMEDLAQALTEEDDSQYDAIRDGAEALHSCWKATLRLQFRRYLDEFPRELTKKESERLREMGLV